MSSHKPGNPLARMLLLFSHRRRWQSGAILLLTFFGAVAELMSVGSVIPFLHIVTSPEDAAQPGIVQPMLGWIRVRYSGDLILPAALILIGASVLSALVRILLAWISSRFAYALAHDLSMLVYRSVIRQPYSAYVQRNSASVLAGMEKVNVVGGHLLNVLLNALSSFFIALGIVGLLVAVDPIVAAGVGGSVVAMYVAMGLVSRSMLLRLGRRQGTLTTSRVKMIQETLGGMRDIILDRSHRTFEWQYQALDAEFRRVTAKINFISVSPRFVVEAFGISLIALFAMYYAGRAGGVLAAIPVLGALALGAQRLLPLAQNINLAWTYYSGMTGLIEDVMELLDTPAIPISSPLADTPHPLKVGVELRSVGFGYGSGAALSKIDYVIPKGRRIGIVGPTGSGKTTFVDVVMGLLNPTEGEILIDGVVLSDATRAAWHGQIAHVPQAIFLIDGSIASNIAFGTPNDAIDMERVLDAARRANVSEFVELLPERYETLVGERGIRLSGGQRQRLGIARALYKRANVLVLDEATSALDDTTEKTVMEGIEKLDRDLTILIIAHRVSTLATCDELIRLERGQIVARGPYEEIANMPAASQSETEAKA